VKNQHIGSVYYNETLDEFLVRIYKTTDSSIYERRIHKLEVMRDIGMADLLIANN
jgi:hypothetical protein